MIVAQKVTFTWQSWNRNPRCSRSK